MQNADIKIGDAAAAASAFGALSRLSGLTSVPVDRSEFSARLSRVRGRARALATALDRYVEANGFEAFRSAIDRTVDCDSSSSSCQRRTDAEAAAMVSAIHFDELDRTALTFSASGLY